MQVNTHSMGIFIEYESLPFYLATVINTQGGYKRHCFLNMLHNFRLNDNTQLLKRLFNAIIIPERILKKMTYSHFFALLCIGIFYAFCNKKDIFMCITILTIDNM